MSIGVHASLLTAAAVATMQAPVAPTEPLRGDTLIFVAPTLVAPMPTERSGTHSRVLQLPRLSGLQIPQVPSIDAVPTRITGLEITTGNGSLISANTTQDPTSGGIFSAATVDRIVMPRSNNPQPEYPRQLRSARLEGSVVARFVVDTAGRVERGSVEVLEATHALFDNAVRQWLPRTTYYPAESSGRRVRQLVEQRIAFTLR